MEDLLLLSRVGKCYGSRVIFKDVSCSISAASIVLLAGANGAGKSTLLRLMAGLSAPTAGSLSCPLEPEEIGYLGHATFLYPTLSAMENLAFWRSLYALPADDAALLVLLERVELSRFAHERTGTFSRGMAQRLNLARILLLAPRLLLLDEPATGLDTRSSALLRREILAARDRGAGVVWISHDIPRDAPLADQIFVLEEKKLRQKARATGEEEKFEED